MSFLTTTKPKRAYSTVDDKHYLNIPNHLALMCIYSIFQVFKSIHSVIASRMFYMVKIFKYVPNIIHKYFLYFSTHFIPINKLSDG